MCSLCLLLFTSTKILAQDSLDINTEETTSVETESSLNIEQVKIIKEEINSDTITLKLELEGNTDINFNSIAIEKSTNNNDWKKINCVGISDNLAENFDYPQDYNCEDFSNELFVNVNKFELLSDNLDGVNIRIKMLKENKKDEVLEETNWSTSNFLDLSNIKSTTEKNSVVEPGEHFIFTFDKKFWILAFVSSIAFCAVFSLNLLIINISEKKTADLK